MNAQLHFGYNTNGFTQHKLEDVISILCQLGYDGIEIGLDQCHYHPFESPAAHLDRIRQILCRSGLAVVVGTGVPFALGSSKHEPTLMSANLPLRERRLAYVRAALDVAVAWGSSLVVMNSGLWHDAGGRLGAWHRLVDGCRELCAYAKTRSVRIAFEPEPGYFVESVADYRRLKDDVGCDELVLNLDVGHVWCTEAAPPEAVIRQLDGEIANVHIEDIRGRVHNHLPLGTGEMQFAPILQSLLDIGYNGSVSVELHRYGHQAQEMALQSLRFLSATVSSLSRS